MLLLEDSGRTKKVTTRADITQQEEKNTSCKRHGKGEGRRNKSRGGERERKGNRHGGKRCKSKICFGSGGHRQMKKEEKREGEKEQRKECPEEAT